MSTIFVFFHGRNTAGIIQDAKRFLGLDLDRHRVILVIRRNEQEPIPGEIKKVERIFPDGQIREIFVNDEVIVVANGGATAQQQVTYNLIKQASVCRYKLKIYDLQSYGANRMFEENAGVPGR